MKSFSLIAAAFSVSVLVSACGGGGGGSSGSETAQDLSSGLMPDTTPDTTPSVTPAKPTYATGQWEGSMSNGRKMEGFVLEDGSYYIFYSLTNRNSVLGGFIQGKGSSSFGNFTSSDARDFNVETRTVLSGSGSGTYVEGNTLSGSFTYDAGDSFSFTTTYDKNFTKIPTLTAFAGYYPGSLVSTLGVEDVTIRAQDTGEISATTSSGCTLSGTGTPRAEGYVFDVSIKFGGAPCLFGEKTLQGIAYLHPTKRLYLALSDAEKSSGLLFATQKTVNP